MTTFDSTNIAECTSVLIAEDQEYLREGISNILAAQPGITLLGAAADGLAAYQMALDLLPQVLLLDIHMPGLNGLAVAERIRTQCPEIGLLALSQYDDLTYVQSFLVTSHDVKDIPEKVRSGKSRALHGRSVPWQRVTWCSIRSWRHNCSRTAQSC